MIHTAAVAGLFTAANHMDPDLAEDEYQEQLEQLAGLVQQNVETALSTCGGE